MKKLPKPVFSSAGLFLVRWDNYLEYVRAVEEREQQRRWQLAFAKTRSKKRKKKCSRECIELTKVEMFDVDCPLHGRKKRKTRVVNN